MAKHVFLIGFMGSGKTHWGKVVAEKLALPFIDLDAFIEKNEGKSIANIFAASSENAFRELERKYLFRVADLPPTIIATGGGTPCFSDNMAWMNATGTTIYLKTPVEMLFERLKNEREKRPLLKNLNEAKLRNFIQNLLEKREPFYRQASFTITRDDDELHFRNELISLIRSYP